MNRQYGMTDNLKWILWTGIQFFALYVCDLDRDTEKYRKEFNILSHLMIIVTSVSAVTSLVMMVQSLLPGIPGIDYGAYIQTLIMERFLV